MFFQCKIWRATLIIKIVDLGRGLIDLETIVWANSLPMVKPWSEFLKQFYSC